MEKISIIIPIYNQEKYLEKCLNSIEKQTYQNFEVLMIDDGSTDQSGKICQEFYQRDKRFKYIKQKNAGVAAARNTGLREVAGDLIGFIDPDDWIDPIFYERLMELYKQYKADIVSCGRMEIFDENVPTNMHIVDNYNVMLCNTEEAITLLVENTRIKSHLWNRIYVSEVWEEIYFEEGRVYEDVCVLHQIFDKAKNLVFTDEPLYYYRQHSASIVGSKSLKKQIDFCYAFQCRFDFLTKKYPKTKKDILKNYKYEVIGLVNILIDSSWREVISNYKEIKKIVNGFMKIDDINFEDQIITLLKRSVFFTIAFYKLRKKIKKIIMDGYCV